MIGCDNADCEIEWFHFKCMNITRAPRGNWFCKSCRSSNGNSTKRKLTFEDENEKEMKKPRTQKSKCPDCNSIYSQNYLKTHLKKFCLGIK